jgi:hypothetical protein
MIDQARRGAGHAPFLAALTGLSYVGAGLAFLFDPSSAFAPGTVDYWRALAEGSFARQAFLASFALAGLFGLLAMPSLAWLAARRPARLEAAPDAATTICLLGGFGHAVTALSYARVLGGEPLRAAAYVAGGEQTRAAILSFSISLDSKGVVVFLCVGLFLAAYASLAGVRRALPIWLAVVGLIGAALYLTAFVGLWSGREELLKIAAGAGGVVIAPIWWFGLARRLQLALLRVE